MIFKKFLFVIIGLLFTFSGSITKLILPTEKVKKNTTIQSFTLEKANTMNFADLQHSSHASHASHDSHSSHGSHSSHASHYSSIS